MANKRIIEQTASTTISNDDWFVKDSPTGGTTKILTSLLRTLLGGDNFASTYDSSLTYYTGNMCIYNGILYECKAFSGTTGTFDSSKWTQLTITDYASKLLASDWRATSSYVRDDLVSYRGSIYRCASDSATVGTFVHTEWITANWDSIKIVLLRNNIAKEYDGSEIYNKGDLVFESPYYLCVCKENGVTGTFDTSKWITDGTISDALELVDEQIIENIAGEYDSEVEYSKDALCFKDGVLYIANADTTGTWDSTKWDSTSIAELIAEIQEQKADTNGKYEDLFAGNLVTDEGTTDTKPYLYRQSPSDSSYVDLSLVGGTVAWNQLARDMTEVSSSYTPNNWYVSSGSATVSNNIATLTPSAQYGRLNCMVSYTANHKMLVMADIKLSNSTNAQSVSLGIYAVDNLAQTSTNKATATTDWQKLYAITYSTSVNIVSNRIILTDSRASDWGTIQMKNCVCIDLTQAFGITIANYVYSLEQATEGSGIAWLKSNGFLTKDYYAYQSGKLESVNVASRKVVGFNQWDEEWDVGSINGQTGENASGNYLRSKGYIRVIEGEEIYFTKPNTTNNYMWIYAYDADKNFLKPFSGGGYYTLGNTVRTLTIPQGVAYIRFLVDSQYGTTYKNDICVNISDTAKNGTYEPYNSTTYPFDSSKILRGIPKLSNGQMYYDGDGYESDSSVTRRYGVVDLGTLEWVYQSDNTRFYVDAPSNLKKPSVNTDSINGICSKYVVSPYQNYANGNIAVAASGSMFVKDSNYTDATTFKTAMNGVYLVYELATPTTESATPFTNPQLVGSTEEFVDAQTSASTPTRDVDIPCGQESKYHTDLKAKLEELAKIPSVPSTNGTYTLKATRSASGVAYNWVSG